MDIQTANFILIGTIFFVAVGFVMLTSRKSRAVGEEELINNYEIDFEPPTDYNMIIGEDVQNSGDQLHRSLFDDY
ncbi:MULTISPECIES: hypothetical protein [unclassified Pseudoalteromonas]|uniref:hypothetical protein n=1 Tax=unclassified Pseudoalteromonas TaxID=194690 RepID=UPI002358E65B|nr:MULTISPECIES: hypothetical protein [unclassified Pseudoalteromonas]MDC9575614.1 hypothetical protein [Pseudoalteromonas sp. GABNS16A]MDC9611587.1 hypothetical protein [Pseudoalteromonas sp. GABNS16H]